MRGEQAIFNLEIKKKSGLSINPYIHHSKVFSSGLLVYHVFDNDCTSQTNFCWEWIYTKQQKRKRLVLIFKI